MTDIFKEFKTDMTNIPQIEVILHENDECKHTDIVSSQSKLFYIQYTPKNIVCQCWYIVQVDLEATLVLNKDDLTRDLYHYVFLAKHPNDANKSDEFSSFWPEWNKYTRCPTTNEIVYSDQILIRPSHYPNKERFIQLYYNLPLLGSSLDPHSIIGPFDFDKIEAYNRTRQNVHTDDWKILYAKCIKLGITPPTFGSNSSQKPAVHLLSHRKRKFQEISP